MIRQKLRAVAEQRRLLQNSQEGTRSANSFDELAACVAPGLRQSFNPEPTATATDVLVACAASGSRQSFNPEPTATAAC
jgi:hypothetical protein